MSEPLTIIEAGRAERNYWRDLWRYRELLAIFAWRDVAVRYKQTIFGVAWAVIRPLLTMVVFTIIFSRIAKLPSDGIAPYPILVFTGILPWFLFSGIIGDVSGSIISNAGLISKIYFPRLIIPLGRAAAALIDFAINLVMLALLMIYFGFAPGSHVYLLPAFVFMALAASLGPAMWIASVSMKYRDFTFITPFLLQLGLYVSPVGFSSSMVPNNWRFLYSLNPLVGIIDGFRWCILGGESQLYWPGFIISLLVISGFFWIGIRTFRATERSFADLI